MTTELTYLTLTALLGASMWIPFVVGINTQQEHETKDFTCPHDLSQMDPWVHRPDFVEKVIVFGVAR